MHKITPLTLGADLKVAEHRLLELARELSQKNVSDNCLYITSAIHNDHKNAFEERRYRMAENRSKRPSDLKPVLAELTRQFSDLHDINLFVYRADSDRTIIDVRYFLRSTLPAQLREQLTGQPPTLHVKVMIPPWRRGDHRSFDINWEHHPWSIHWNLFWAQVKMRSIRLGRT